MENHLIKSVREKKLLKLAFGQLIKYKSMKQGKKHMQQSIDQYY